jgi:hypothetical protein
MEEEDGLLALEKNDNKDRIRGNPHHTVHTNDTTPAKAILFDDEEADILKIQEVLLADSFAFSMFRLLF